MNGSSSSCKHTQAEPELCVRHAFDAGAPRVRLRLNLLAHHPPPRRGCPQTGRRGTHHSATILCISRSSKNTTPQLNTNAGAELKRQTATVDCPKSMVGRVIGKNGETIKALQTYTGALIQIDQTVEPTKVTISGTPHSLSLAVSMVTDIVKGTFKGFALLRQITNAGVRPMGGVPGAPVAQPRPVYAPGYGLIPPSQLYGADDRTAGVVAVGRQPGAIGWPQAGGVAPSQLILGLPQAAGVMQPLAGQQALLAGAGMGGMDEAAMMAAGAMGGYGFAAPAAVYAAYGPPPGAAGAGGAHDAYGAGAMPGGAALMAAPAAALRGGGGDLMYAAAGGGGGAGMMHDPSGGMMGAGGAQARMYGAAASPRTGLGNGLPRGGGGGSGSVPRSGSSSELTAGGGGGGVDALGGAPNGGAAGGGGGWVQVMDPDGKVYLINAQHAAQATGAAQ